MKHALIVALLFATPALASPEDDFIACLVGRSAVALQAQTGPKDSEAAQTVAYEHCPQPAAFAADTEVDGIEDFVNMMVEQMAGAWTN
jgi:hypothetical protein